MNSYYFFFNTSSGGTKGEQLMQINNVTLNLGDTNIHFFNLNEHASRKEGFAQISRDSHKSIRLVVAGGDGSIMWIIELMIQYHIDIQKCIIIPLPFGTGNDFANSLGWGTSVPDDVIGKNNEQLLRFLQNWKLGVETTFDIWDVELKVALVEGSITEIKRKKNGFDQVQVNLNQHTFHKKMSNYFSIGVDARIGYGFDKLRTNSRWGNKCVYCWEGFKKLFISTPKVNDAIENVELFNEDTNNKQLLFKTKNQTNLRDSTTVPGNPATLVCLNINSYSGGVRDIWKNAQYQQGYRQHNDSIPSYCDGKLEILSFDSILGIGSERILPGNATKLNQSTPPIRLNFRTDEPLKTYFQVDGQYYAVSSPVYVQISPCLELPDGKIRVLRKI